MSCMLSTAGTGEPWPGGEQVCRERVTGQPSSNIQERSVRVAHLGELRSFGHRGAPCRWLRGVPVLQVAGLPWPPCGGSGSQDDSGLT